MNGHEPRGAWCAAACRLLPARGARHAGRHGAAGTGGRGAAGHGDHPWMAAFRRHRGGAVDGARRRGIRLVGAQAGLARHRLRRPDALGLAAARAHRAPPRLGARPARPQRRPRPGPSGRSARAPVGRAREPRPLHARALEAGHAPLLPDRPPAGAAGRRRGPHPHSRGAPRRRQDGDAARGAEQARAAQRRGVRGDQAAPGRRGADGGGARRRRSHRDGPPPPRAARRRRLSRRAGRRGDPAGRPGDRGGRHLRRADLEPPLPHRLPPQEGARHPARRGRHAARPGRGGGVPQLLLGPPGAALVVGRGGGAGPARRVGAERHPGRHGRSARRRCDQPWRGVPGRGDARRHAGDRRGLALREGER